MIILFPLTPSLISFLLKPGTEILTLYTLPASHIFQKGLLTITISFVGTVVFNPEFAVVFLARPEGVFFAALTAGFFDLRLADVFFRGGGFIIIIRVK